ncbi:MAG: Lrp/AsnC ligand binding domain-containing protein [Crenarchaeota archaeon]|nr:Lrp/AsnC ligand binding domain-containing protein [Thermoproteota archaeon]
MPISYVMINSNLGTDDKIIEKIKEIMLTQDDVKFEIQGVYGVYDIILKLSSDNSEKLSSIVKNDIRKIQNIQSTLTMMVIEQQEKS